jgi:hypothetical protein
MPPQPSRRAARRPHATPTPSARSHNLPAPTTPLVDRAAELAAVRARLGGSETRLVTLTGPPGVG